MLSTLFRQVQTVIEEMGNEKENFAPFEKKLKDYDNLLAHDSAEFLITRSGLFFVLVGSIFIQAAHTAADLNSINYVTRLAVEGINSWTINTGRGLFILQIVATIISTLAIFMFRKEGLKVNAFVGRTDKFTYESKELIKEYAEIQRHHANKHEILYQENEELKAKLEILRKEKQKKNAEDRLGGRPATKDDLG